VITLEDTTYNEARDGMIPIVPGTYPAHVSGLEGKDLTTRAGEQKVFNCTFLIASDVEKTQVVKLIKNGGGEYTPQLDDDNNPLTISAAFMSGKRFNSTGIWLTPQPKDGEGWKNRRYKEFFESLGVQFPTNKAGDTLLAEVEEMDVVGHPCFVKLGREEYEKDGESRSVWKVFDVFPWTDGDKLSEDEVSSDDLPF
jgi:hypothetical protein